MKQYKKVFQPVPYYHTSLFLWKSGKILPLKQVIGKIHPQVLLIQEGGGFNGLGQNDFDCHPTAAMKMFQCYVCSVFSGKANEMNLIN